MGLEFRVEFLVCGIGVFRMLFFQICFYDLWCRRSVNACLVRIWECSQSCFVFGLGFRGVWSSGFGVLAEGLHGFGRRVKG